MYKSTGTKLLFFKHLNPAQGYYSTGDEKMEEGLEEIPEFTSSDSTKAPDEKGKRRKKAK